MDKVDKKKEEQNPCLEIPSEFAISMRKEVMMENLMKGRRTAPTTSKLEASSILGKVKAFLPQMKSANEQLETMDKESILIDSVPAEGEAYIEMNLATYSDSEDSGKGVLDSDTDSEDDEEEAGGLQSELLLRTDQKTGNKTPLVQLLEPDKDT